MTCLILVRHGQTEANLNHFLQGQSDGALNDTGKQQAKKLAVNLKDMKIDRILSSDMRRARNTAAAIAGFHELAVEENKILREWNCGKLDGLPAEELHKALADSDLPLADFRPEDGETLREVRERAAAFLEEIEKDFEGLTVLVCSHGDFLRMLTSILQDIKFEEANNIRLKNASYSVFEKEGRHWKTVSLNNTADSQEKLS